MAYFDSIHTQSRVKVRRGPTLDLLAMLVWKGQLLTMSNKNQSGVWNPTLPLLNRLTSSQCQWGNPGRCSPRRTWSRQCVCWRSSPSSAVPCSCDGTAFSWSSSPSRCRPQLCSLGQTLPSTAGQMSQLLFRNSFLYHSRFVLFLLSEIGIRSLRIWNLLPRDTVEAPTSEHFQGDTLAAILAITILAHLKIFELLYQAFALDTYTNLTPALCNIYLFLVCHLFTAFIVHLFL